MWNSRNVRNSKYQSHMVKCNGKKTKGVKHIRIKNI